MRLINADALKQEIRKGTRYFVRVWDPKGREKWEMEKDLSLKEIDEIIDNAPTIDAEPVVRCCDCKYLQCNMRQDGILPFGVDEYECRHWCGSCDPTDFCSYGERREE